MQTLVSAALIAPSLQHSQVFLLEFHDDVHLFWGNKQDIYNDIIIFPVQHSLETVVAALARCKKPKWNSVIAH